jgi:hypothetical protein
MERIKTEIEIFGKTADMRERYQRLQEAEAKAREVLRNYEHDLLDQLAESGSSAQPS